MQVEVKKIGRINNKLQLVKFIKDITGWGLKEAKNWADNLDYQGTSVINVIDPVRFELEYMSIDGIQCDSKERVRQRKLVGIGVGDMDDKISVLSEKMTEDLIKNYGTTYPNIKMFFKDFLTEFEEEKLNELLKRL